MVKVEVICNECMQKIGEREIDSYFNYFEMCNMKHMCLACKHKKGLI